MYKRILAVVVVLIAAAGAVFAQQAKIPYVDIEEARAKIQVLEEANTKMKAEIDESRAVSSDLEDQIEERQKQMDSNSKTVGINNNKISRNADEINLLNASIEKTEAQKEVLTSYIDNVNEINSEAESFLGAAK